VRSEKPGQESTFAIYRFKGSRNKELSPQECVAYSKVAMLGGKKRQTVTRITASPMNCEENLK
jgi:hypothetical protein